MMFRQSRLYLGLIKRSTIRINEKTLENLFDNGEIHDEGFYVL